jgi:hypothetical protein
VQATRKGKKQEKCGEQILGSVSRLKLVLVGHSGGAI